MSWLFASGGWSIGALASASVLSVNIQGWLPLELTDFILPSKGLSSIFSRTTVWKHQFTLPYMFVWFCTEQDPRGLCFHRVEACMLSRFSRVRLLCDPMDCSLPGSSVHGILQARVPELVAMPFSRGSSWCKNRIPGSYVSCIGRQFFPISATWKAPHRAHSQWEIHTVGRVTILGDHVSLLWRHWLGGWVGH